MPFKTKEVDRMAKNELNKPEDVKIDLENKQTESVAEAPALK